MCHSSLGVVLDSRFHNDDGDDGRSYNGDWDVLVGDNYPATRLSGVPLGLDRSQIDYVIVSRFRMGARTGLSGQEISAATATVHTGLIQAQGGADAYRRDLSDHLPVTVRVQIIDDDD